MISVELEKIIAVIKLKIANNLIKGLLFEKEDKRKYKTEFEL